MTSKGSVTWTKENLQMLLAKLKASIPEAERCFVYSKAQKSVDWNKVAFPPFSPAECEEKWKQILQKMRKIRSLTELITEAEDVISNPNQNKKIHPELPKKPSPPNALYFEENFTRIQEQHPEMSAPLLFTFTTKMYKGLSEEEKAPYVEKFNLANKEYKKKMLAFRLRYDKLSSRDLKNYQNSDTSDEGEDADFLPHKPPRNSYNLFCKEQKGIMKGSSKRSCMAQWAQLWGKLDPSVKREYNTRCSAMRLEYAKKMKSYAKIRKRTSAFIPGEPKMPPQSSNMIFYHNQMALLKDQIPDRRQRLAKASRMFKKLSTKEKEHYKEIMHDSMKKYWRDLQKWFDMLSTAQQQEYLKQHPNKCPHLTQKLFDAEDLHHLPSDSEDEDIEDSSSDEEDNMEWNEDGNEEEEEEENITFVID
ncbi:nucleolar transcription factor 1-like [Parambassis ranga]|uniref:Nucleolar transcription factor 1-like n=1 Tax=Parambassis ranga TaxID=210632 RepID=A0A6P7KEN4_9TELE|nr:nucleolar transcription factor 1-like [Parambassis ranga]